MYHARPGEIIQLLRSYFSYRQLSLLGFPHQGFGLERRHELFAPHWQEHLFNCKQSQARTLDYFHENISSEKISSLAVYGAGRLYDLDLPLLRTHIKNILLQDADPSCLFLWEKLCRDDKTNFQYEIGDLTNLFWPWYRILTLAKNKRFFQLRECFNKFIQTENKYFYNPKLLNHQIIFSQNILSQIPLFFYTLTKKLLAKNPTALTDLEQLVPEIQKFFILQHLDNLNISGARIILLTTDLSACFYRTKTLPPLSSLDLLPVSFENNLWQINQDLSETLEKVSYQNLLEPTIVTNLSEIQAYLTNYRIIEIDNWLWWIKPIAIEDKEDGAVHYVGSVFALSKN